MQTIYLDISNKGIFPCIQAKQTDVGRQFDAVVTDGGIPLKIENSTQISIWFEGSSGVGNYSDIDGVPSVSVDGNKITVTLIEQMLKNAGDGTLCLLLNSTDGKQIGLWNIPYSVQHIPGFGSEKAGEYFTAFSESATSLARSADEIKKKQERIDYQIKTRNKSAAGLIYPLATETVPNGFLLCDGAEYSRTEYSELFEAIGTVYGAGDDETTFNVPNLKTRVPVGAGENYALGDTGGKEKVTLEKEEMPAHKHDVHSLAYGSVDWDDYRTTNYHIMHPNDSAQVIPPNSDLNVSSVYGGDTSTIGGNQPHDNMQPYTVVNYIISTGKEIEFVVGGGTPAQAVLYTEQTLTPEQQAQARANIGAAAGDAPEYFNISGEFVECEPQPGTPLHIVSRFTGGHSRYQGIMKLYCINSKNLIDIAAGMVSTAGGTVVEKDGITATINEDSTITINGTTGDSNMYPVSFQLDSLTVFNNHRFPPGTYTTYRDSYGYVNVSVTSESGAVAGNKSNTFTIDEWFKVNSVSLILIKNTTFDNFKFPLAFVRGTAIPSDDLAFSGDVYKTKVAQQNADGGTIDWTTGEVFDSNGDYVETIAAPECLALSGTNYIWSDYGVVEVTGTPKKEEDGLLRYTEQTLTPEQQAQARANLGLGDGLLTPEEQEAIVLQVIDSLGGTPVFGTVDENNNIILTGTLPDGTYTLKYEDENGDVTDIGTLTHTSA